MSIEDHIRTLWEYQEELHNLGQELKDGEFAIVLLMSLPDSWNNYISSIDSTTLDDSSKLTSWILEHDQ